MAKQYYSPEAIKELREKRGMSKKTLADKAGVTLMTIYRVENGQNCSIRLLQRIAQELDSSLVDLLNPSTATNKFFYADC